MTAKLTGFMKCWSIGFRPALPLVVMPDQSPLLSRRQRRRLAAVLLVVSMLVAAFALPLADWARSLESWNQAQPVAGPVVFVFGAIGAAALFVPGSVIAMVAGYLFGFVAGTIYAQVALSIGAVAAWLAGRFLVRNWAKRRIEKSQILTALDRAVGQKGILVVALARASLVVPYNLFNYVLGATGIRALPYFTGTSLGIVPPTVLYGYLGSLARSIEDIQSGRLTTELPGTAVLVVGVLAVVSAIFVIQRTAARILREQLNP